MNILILNNRINALVPIIHKLKKHHPDLPDDEIAKQIKRICGPKK